MTVKSQTGILAGVILLAVLSFVRYAQLQALCCRSPLMVPIRVEDGTVADGAFTIGIGGSTHEVEIRFVQADGELPPIGFIEGLDAEYVLTKSGRKVASGRWNHEDVAGGPSYVAAILGEFPAQQDDRLNVRVKINKGLRGVERFWPRLSINHDPTVVKEIESRAFIFKLVSLGFGCAAIWLGGVIVVRNRSGRSHSQPEGGWR